MASSNNTEMDPPMQSTTEIAMALIRELHVIRGRRYQWTLGIRDRMLDDWREHYVAYEAWFQKASDNIKKLKDEGSCALAERLTTVILARPMVYDPANFALSIPTGWGEEAFQITGSSEVREVTSKRIERNPFTASGDSDLGDDLEVEVLRTQPGYYPQVPTGDISQFLSLAQPIDIDLGDNFEFENPSVRLHDAVADKLWITPTLSGLAFCLTCNCPEIPHSMMPLATTAAGSHNLIARHFHTNPFLNNFALVHMLQAHNKAFTATPGGMRTMIKKYGRRGQYISKQPGIIFTDVHITVDFPDDNVPPNKWVVAMSNFAVQTWHGHLSSHWATLRQKYQPREVQDRGQRSQLRRLEDVKRTIEADALLGTAHIFQWPEYGPGRESWVVICSHLDCEAPNFPHHPLRNGRAIEHFRLHGISLRDGQEVLYLFGLKGARISC